MLQFDNVYDAEEHAVSRINRSHHWEVQLGRPVQQGWVCKGGHLQGEVRPIPGRFLPHTPAINF